MDNKSVLLVDDHRLFRAGLKNLIEVIPGYRVVAEASDGSEVKPLIEKHDPDVVLMDITMPNTSGLEALRTVREADAHLPVIILSMHDSAEFVLQAMNYGANGYLLKDAAEVELELALDSVSQNHTYLSPRAADKVIKAAVHGQESDTGGSELTPRQQQILRCIALGKNTKTIAWELNVSAKTVESHRAQIMERLGIRDVPGLVRYAIKNHLVELE